MSSKRKTPWPTIAFITVLAVVAGGMFYYQSATTKTDERPLTWIHESAGHPFYAIVSLGFLDACEDTGADCKIFASEEPGVPSKLNACDMMLADTGTSGLLIMHDDASMDACLENIDAPWINYGRYNDAPGWLGQVGADPLLNAVVAAELMAEAADYEGMILMSQHGFDSVANDVADKFREVVESYGMTTSESIALGSEYTEQIASASALLTKYPDAVGVFAGTAYAPTTWTIVAKEHGLEKGDLIIIGYDPIRENLDSVRDGWVYGLIDQPIYDLAYLAVETFVAHHNGEETERRQMMDANMVTADNVDDYYEFADRIDEYLANR